MPTVYDWRTDSSQLSTSTYETFLDPVTGNFTVSTVLVFPPPKGATGVRISTAGGYVLHFAVGDVTGLTGTVVQPDIVQLSTTLVLQQVGTTASLWYSIDDEATWTLQTTITTPAAPNQAGAFVYTSTPGTSVTGLIAEPRLLPGELLSGGLPSSPAERFLDIGTAPVVQPPALTLSQESIIHGIVGAQFGDLELDVGKSVHVTQRYVDDIFITDTAAGVQRYWVINWAKSFPQANWAFAETNYFKAPATYRREQWAKAQAAATLAFDDNDWVIFVDAHEGLSSDTRSKPDDYLVAPYASYLYREIARANAAGQDRIVLPFFVYVRGSIPQNVQYNDPYWAQFSAKATQVASAPYYLPYQGMTRIIKVSALKNPAFDWTLLDTPVPIPANQLPEAPYLNAVVGTATTPDPGPLPREHCFIFKVRGPDLAGNANQTVVAQYDADSQRSWLLRRSETSGAFSFGMTPNGTAAGNLLRNVNAVAPTGADEWLAMAVKLNDGSNICRLTSYSSTNGTTWTPLTSDFNSGASVVPFDSNAVVRIGAYTTTGDTWNGRIYSVEARTGLDPAAGGSAAAVPGYVSFPNPNTSSSLTLPTITTPTNLDVMLRIKNGNTLAAQYPIGNFGTNLSWGVLTDASGGLSLIMKNAAGGNVTAAYGSALSPTGYNWWRITHTAATGVVDIFCQPDSDQVPTTWGTVRASTTTSLTAALSSTTQVKIGVGGNFWAGEIRQAILPNHGFDFNAATDLPPSMNPATVPTIVSRSGHSMTVTRGATPLTIVPTTVGQLWKFDASEYPGTGTSYVDPRGRTWTLTSAAAVVPYQPLLVKLQLITYGYAHWNLQDIVPPATEVPALTAANDLGWQQRCLMSRVLPITGLPYGNHLDPVATWISPASDVGGTRGPWCLDLKPTTGATFPFPPETLTAATAMVLSPLYDLIFRLNVRDGLWYEAGGLGTVPMYWDANVSRWGPVVDTNQWHNTSNYVQPTLNYVAIIQ
jgi:hypothetical protein